MSVFQPYRTAFHFQPSKNWMNDPNGPMVYNGLYHLFYQWSTEGVVWIKKIVWGHSTSTDLVNWTAHEPAIWPSQPSDENGCWTGSVTILPDGTPVILYTGADQNNHQVQNLATPRDLSDPYLIEWVKSPLNPLITPPTEDNILPNSFRDPTTAWLGADGKWRIIIGSCRDKTGIAIMYTSEDFIHWTKTDQPLHSAEDTGMWECPDFFPVSTFTHVGLDTSTTGPEVKHVLKVSPDGTVREFYTIGTYDLVKDVYVPDKGSVEDISGLRLDYGRFYASKTFFDSLKNRRILWGWIHETSSLEDDIKKGWSGLQAVPREVWLDKSGKQLVQWPIEEIEKLREGQVDIPDKFLKAGTKTEIVGVTASQADIELVFELPELDQAEELDPSWTNQKEVCIQMGASVKGRGIGPFGLMVLASEGLEEYTSVFFRIFKGDNNKYVVFMGSDQSRSSLNNSNDMSNYGTFLDIDPCQDKLSLRILIDRSIVESYGGGGKACITARVYPTIAAEDQAHLYVFNYGAADVRISGLSAWSMKKAEINIAES